MRFLVADKLSSPIRHSCRRAWSNWRHRSRDERLIERLQFPDGGVYRQRSEVSPSYAMDVCLIHSLCSCSDAYQIGRIPEREYEVRTDLRKERVFTIDPDTAKDFDDALSIKKNEDGTYDVGVHIADVAHLVKPNTALDRDARKRATSVYLVQRAVPMIPPALSEQICSLILGQERLTFSAIFTVNEDAKVLKKRFEKTIIKYDFFTQYHVASLNRPAGLVRVSRTLTPRMYLRASPSGPSLSSQSSML